MTNNIFTPDINLAKKTFPDADIDYSKLLMTEEGIYSVSGKDAAKILAKIIYKYVKTYDATITDGTGNNGSDTLILAKYYKHVNSIEYDKTNYKALKNNIDVYNLKNVNAINGDTTVELKNLTQDVIYIDAPWGGPDYKKYNQLKLYLGKMELSDIFNEYKSKAKVFVFKVPYNYNINYFILKTNVDKIKIYTNKNNNNKITFLLLVIKLD
jgi:16S rRNA G966 N2-methylase RsmD